MTTDIDTTLTPKQLKSAVHDYEKSAALMNLLYVNINDAGIERIKRGKNFNYVFKNNAVKEKEEIERINKLVIPPAWEQVWICKSPNGHIQCTGVDAKARKQYKYHTLWQRLRNETKFYNLREFGNSLPTLRLQMEKDIAQKELTEEKVIAAVLGLMERTYIRIGNANYEKLYGSYGLTTLKDKHVKINGNDLLFSFKGKKGILHTITLKNKKLAKIVKDCREIPGKELFQFRDVEGNYKSIDSGMVNNYIKRVTGKDFSAKDFRTWAGSIHLLTALKEMQVTDTVTDVKKNLIEALDSVSKKLGNTRTVCKKYYVHPVIINLYENKKLNDYINDIDKIEVDDNFSSLNKDELILMKILDAT